MGYRIVGDSLSTLVREHRRRIGITQEELARRSGMSVRALRDIEQGRVRQPHQESLEQLTAALALSGVQHDEICAAARGEVSSGDTQTLVQVLGPLSASRGGRALVLATAAERGILGLLALQLNRAVPRDEIVESLWGDHPPGSCVAQVHAAIGQLRRILEPARRRWSPGVVLQLDPAGYVLHLDSGRTDLSRFASLTAHARHLHGQGAAGAALETLDDALRYWRGPVLDGEPARLRGHPAAALATRKRLTAALLFADLAIKLRRYDRAVEQLRELTDDEPYHEGLHARLIVALAGSGERAGALQLFAEVRGRIVDDLGVEPASQLQAAHLRVLRAEVPTGPELVRLQQPILHDDPALGGVTQPDPAGQSLGQPTWQAKPAQLPADVAAFTGRGQHLHQLDRLLVEPDRPATTVVISSITGTAGVGKTALAVHWAHRVRRRFPDGQLYVNLRGFDPTGVAVTPAEAICRFLDAINVSPARIPADPDALAALYRTTFAERRMLIVLDNARDAEQVRPLLPGTSAALVLVTSRNQLTSLVALDGAYPLNLDVLADEEARQLLDRRLGRGRVAAEPEAAEEIVIRCARLPLALTIAAARAAQPAQSLASVAADLAEADGRLDALSAGDPVSEVRTVLSWSYTTLRPATARLFRLLGLHPGPDIFTAAAASLAGVPLPQARQLLAELTRANLLTEHSPGRYTLHDLLRAYAADLARTDDDSDRLRTTRRLLDHYLHTAHPAVRLLHPTDDPIVCDPPAPGVTPEHLANREQVMTWLTAEHPVLLAAIRQAANTGFDTHTWQLAWTLTTFLSRRGPWRDLVTTWQTALDAAQRLDDPSKAAYAHRHLAEAHTEGGHYQDAHGHYQHALDLYARVGDQAGQAHTHHRLATLLERQRRPEQALHHAERALALHRAAGHRGGEAAAINAVGWCLALLGDHERALTYCQQAITLMQELGDRHGEADTWDSLGYIHHHLNHHTQAVTSYKHALDVYEALGDHYYTAASLMRLGDTHNASHDRAAARSAWRRALSILTNLDHPVADSVQARLHELQQSLSKPNVGQIQIQVEATPPTDGSVRQRT